MASLHTRKGRTRAALALLLLWFAISWPAGALVDPGEVLHDELPYLVADLSVLVPLSAIGLYGLARSRPWAGLLVLVIMGAFTYDAVNFLTFVARERLPGLPAILSAGLIPIVLAIMAWLTFDSIRELVPAASPRHRASAGRFEASEVNAALD
jgi:hypothetical protein